MKRINKYISLLLVTTLLASCDKFDEINTNPDATTKVTSSLLADRITFWILHRPVPVNHLYMTDLLAKQMAWGRKYGRLPV